MVLIAPSILSADFLQLRADILASMEAGANMFHIDVMDGSFVPNITVGPFVVQQIRRATVLPLDVHLMIESPDRYLMDFIRAGSDTITVHFEADRHLHRNVTLLKEAGCKAGVAINPATPIESLTEILPDVNVVVLMSVNPGFGGQEFIPRSIEKIRRLKKLINQMELKTLIEVDGGVGPKNAAEIIQAGADILVMGSAFYKSKDYKETIRAVRSA
ncbi:MAG: ribulose-phosphate 3-epimerase [Candidatus Magnetobacterium sp. LHC-1]|uniref:Ribulose-phosphate 3-epimerase n=1 Tax=Candidatus Magnetobacterium casense TaxID=1455061 RepID=A0ABS6RXI4_9BACT|nr:ribulose-phosphate 3-epimerase [Candidatus Magnetobacterium casensis]MBF0609105.1 ribulose-phosphate 3-epimerase [Nitrospirota bacterium]MBV6341340.1 ribulose-phosphate 3-epimerase [Candidatus Magnetobacterium casensis]